MITIILVIAVLLIFPNILKGTDKRAKERKQKEEFQRTLSEEIKRGRRWG